jgi:hypothetical protein
MSSERAVHKTYDNKTKFINKKPKQIKTSNIWLEIERHEVEDVIRHSPVPSAKPRKPTFVDLGDSGMSKCDTSRQLNSLQSYN